MKVCFKCKTAKPFTSDFFRVFNLKGKKGLNNFCKSCDSKEVVVRQRKNKIAMTLRSAKQRCCNPNHPKYVHYGQRGIKYKIKNWKEVQKAIGEKPVGMTLDRINNDGHYEIGNLRWADYKTQNNNRRI